MERTDALREWCIEKAMQILRADTAKLRISADEVIDVAKKLEKHINSKDRG